MGTDFNSNNIPFPVSSGEKFAQTLISGCEPYFEQMNGLYNTFNEMLTKEEAGFGECLKEAELAKKRVESLERELEEVKLAEEQQLKDFNALRLEEFRMTEAVKKKHVLIPAKKLEDATQTLESWRHQYEKWKARLEKVTAQSEAVLKFIQDFGIKPISDEETGQFSGIGLSQLDPAFPEYEGVVYFSEFSTVDWSFKGVLSVDPQFPGWREFIEEANRRRDLFYTLSTVRKHWAQYFASTIRKTQHSDVTMSMFEEGDESSMLESALITSDNLEHSVPGEAGAPEAEQPCTIEDEVGDGDPAAEDDLNSNKSGNNSSVLFESDV